MLLATWVKASGPRETQIQEQRYCQRQTGPSGAPACVAEVLAWIWPLEDALSVVNKG